MPASALSPTTTTSTTARTPFCSVSRSLLILLLLLLTPSAAHTLNQQRAVPIESTTAFLTPTPSLPLTPFPPSSTNPPMSTDLVSLTFTNTPDSTVCGTDAISWLYSGPASDTISLAITNVDITGGDPSAPPITQVLTLIAGNLQEQGSFSWSPVNVPAGAYAILAAIPESGNLFMSETFFVFDGTDDSCLSSSSTTSSTSTGFTQAPTPSSTDPSDPSTNTLTTSSGTSTGNPVGGVSGDGSHHHISGGAVAGIVIAIILGAGVAAYLAARWCRYNAAAKRRRSRSSIRSSRFFEKREWTAMGNGSGSGSGSGSLQDRHHVLPTPEIGAGDLLPMPRNSVLGLDYGNPASERIEKDLEYGSQYQQHDAYDVRGGEGHLHPLDIPDAGNYPHQYQVQYDLDDPLAYRTSAASDVTATAVASAGYQKSNFTRPSAPVNGAGGASPSVSDVDAIATDPFASPDATPTGSPRTSVVLANPFTQDHPSHGSDLDLSREHPGLALQRDLSYESSQDQQQLPVALFTSSSDSANLGIGSGIGGVVGGRTRSAPSFPRSVSSSDVSISRGSRMTETDDDEEDEDVGVVRRRINVGFQGGNDGVRSPVSPVVQRTVSSPLATAPTIAFAPSPAQATPVPSTPPANTTTSKRPTRKPVPAYTETLELVPPLSPRSAAAYGYTSATGYINTPTTTGNNGPVAVTTTAPPSSAASSTRERSSSGWSAQATYSHPNSNRSSGSSHMISPISVAATSGATSTATSSTVTAVPSSAVTSYPPHYPAQFPVTSQYPPSSFPHAVTSSSPKLSPSSASQKSFLTSSGTATYQTHADLARAAGLPDVMSPTGGAFIPTLSHKASFDDRPVHYLIPDPPTDEMR